MDNAAIQDYFEALATQFVPVSHTPGTPRFCRFDMEELASRLRQDLDLTNFCLLLETPTGRFQDNGGDGYFDQQEIAFWVIRNVETNDFTNEKITLTLARGYGRQIVVKCLEDMPGLRPDLNTVEYDKVGPVFGNCYGYRYSFTLDDSLNLQLNPAHWNG